MRYNAEEPEGEEGAQNAEEARAQLNQDVAQLRLLHHVVVSLHKGEYRPEAPPPPGGSRGGAAAAAAAPVLAPAVQRLSARELREALGVAGWSGLKDPFMFEAPPDLSPAYRSRQELLADGGPDFQTATVLNDALAAQFGPSMLGEDRCFSEANKENCFTQLNAPALKQGAAPWKCWNAIPPWMRCSMVVISTGPGGSGVAFHKHGTAWLALQQGVKRWFLYPPGGPPTRRAYDAVALLQAWRLPEIVATLAPEERPLELVQREGEGVYVPALWWHATIDEGPTLGIGSQYNMADLDILECHKEYPDSAFVLYHVACEVHKTDEERAVELFEEAIEREPLNFYFCTNQLLFYLNMVFHPKHTVFVIERLMQKVLQRLDGRRQMIVQRFAVPTICNFAEWHAPHDRLVKYAAQAIACAWDALMQLAGPMLPGGERFHLSSELPCLADLRYTASCFQCGRRARGRAGQPGSIRAHRFFCDACSEARERAECGNCGHVGGEGQMGHPGTDFAGRWYCAACWKAWNGACRQGPGRQAAGPGGLAVPTAAEAPAPRPGAAAPTAAAAVPAAALAAGRGARPAPEVLDWDIVD